MRGHTDDQGSLFIVDFRVEDRIPQDHPLRPIKKQVDKILRELDPDLDKLYARSGRPSIPPERLLKGCLLIALYSVRSDRMFCEMLDYNLLFRWFLDMKIEEKSLDQSNFSRLYTRLLDSDLAKRFFETVRKQIQDTGAMSSDHFTVDGTLLEAWASQKSFVPRDSDEDESPKGGGRNPDGDFRGKKRKNDTHASKTDPEAKLMRKGPGKEAKLSFGGHAIMENRNGFLVDILVTDATLPEPEATKQLLRALAEKGIIPSTLAGDKGYHQKEFVKFLRDQGIKPHIAMIEGRKTPGLDRRTTRHIGYKLSQRARKRIEEIFGWMKTFGGLRKSRFVGLARNQLSAYFVGAAYNLIRFSRMALAA